MMDSTYEVVYSNVVSRMKKIGELKNETHLAKVLGVTPQALSNYKKRQTISGDLVVKFSHIYGVSIDWLISGSGEMLKPSSGEDRGNLSTIAFVKAAPFVQGEDRQGIKVTGISTITPDELISVGKLVKILRSTNITISEATKLSIDSLLNSIEVTSETLES